MTDDYFWYCCIIKPLIFTAFKTSYPQFDSPTCLVNLSAPCHNPLDNTWHPVVIVRKNGMGCLFSLSCIHLSSSFSRYLFIFICSSVCLFVAQFPWARPPRRCPAFQYQAPGLDTQVSHTLVTPTYSLHLCLVVSHCFTLNCLVGQVLVETSNGQLKEDRTFRCTLDENSSF